MAQKRGRGVVLLLWVNYDAPQYVPMLTVDDSEFTPDHIECLKEWAANLDIPVEILLGRIVLAAIEGEKYVEKVPTWKPTPRYTLPKISD